MTKKNIAVIGPFNTRGGREIEAGFIGSVLSNHYNVNVFSTQFLENDNDLLQVDKELDVYKKHSPLKYKILNKVGVRKLKKELYFKSLKNSNVISYTQVLKNTDLVVIVAQVISHGLRIIINNAIQSGSKILFRTTGTIQYLNFNSIQKSEGLILEKVDYYIHHSKDNANRLLATINHKFKIIDQCVVNQEALVKERQPKLEIKKFFCCSRLDKNKDVATVIKAFNKLIEHDVELHIYGAGSEAIYLKNLSLNKNIYFHGHVDYKKLPSKIADKHCLIISSKEEAGPYSALEAMCLGIPIISTKVGSMEDRFNGLSISWFNHGKEEELKNAILNYREKGEVEISKMSKDLSNRYHNKYDKTLVAKQYLNLVKKVLE